MKIENPRKFDKLFLVLDSLAIISFPFFATFIAVGMMVGAVGLTYLETERPDAFDGTVLSYDLIWLMMQYSCGIFLVTMYWMFRAQSRRKKNGA